MKRISIALIMLSSLSNACPTCVGRIEHDSPAFFQDEFYLPTDKEAPATKSVANNNSDDENQEDA